jgi:hypothetical protein
MVGLDNMSVNFAYPCKNWKKVCCSHVVSGLLIYMAEYVVDHAISYVVSYVVILLYLLYLRRKSEAFDLSVFLPEIW